MRKVIAAINMSLDGDCNHEALIADDEIHQHYNELLRSTDTLIYGRITYQLMESYWPTVVKNPTGHAPIDEFAVLIDDIHKIIFSHNLKSAEPIATGWKNSKLAMGSLQEEIAALKQQPGKDILIGSRSLIVASLNQGLVDEFQISVQPIISGNGLPLFKDISDRINLKLLRTKTFKSSGAVVFYYTPINK